MTPCIIVTSIMQEVNVEAEGLKKQIEKLEGRLATLNEQLEAARKESKTLKSESKSSAVLESSLKKEEARAEVSFGATSTYWNALCAQDAVTLMCGIAGRIKEDARGG